jgi:hypothetical protein
MKYLIWNFYIFFSLFFILNNYKIGTRQLKNLTEITFENIKLNTDTTLDGYNVSRLGILLKPNNDYFQIVDSVLIHKEELKLFYQNSTDKNLALDSVENYVLETLLNKIIPHWYGTNWSMSGTSQIPQQGFVGCSYFVSNTLYAMGFNFDRAGVAQCSSRNIARTFQLSENVVLLKGCTNQQVIDYVKENFEQGFFIAGLDYHVVYLLYYHDEIFIIHSGKQPPSQVVIEYGETSKGLLSNRHYIGEITTNDSLLVKWLYNEYIPKIEIFEFK